MIEHRQLSPIVVVLATACLPFLFPHMAAAQQAGAGAKTPPPAATPCTDFPPAPRLDDTKDVDSLQSFLNKNYEITKECALETIKGMKDLKSSDGKDWDLFDKKVKQQIDQAREVVQLMQYELLPQIEKLIGDIEASAGRLDRIERDAAVRAKKKDSLMKKADRFKEAAKKLGVHSLALAKQATAMEGERPRMAQEMREKEWDKLLERVEKISTAIAKQAEVLSQGFKILGGDATAASGINP